MTTSARGRGKTRKPAATQWRVICRSSGNEKGRTLFISEISRERAERWLAQHALPPDVESAIIDGREKAPFPVAAFDQHTIKEVPPSEDLANLLDLAKRGRKSEWPSVERQAWNLVQAVLHNARDLDPMSIEALPDLVNWVQESREDVEAELLEVSQ